MIKHPLTPEQQAALDAYHAAETFEQERIAYAMMRAAGWQASYSEPNDDVWHEPWSHGGWGKAE
jgi:hypothetical protein